jgi:hypothetical protein
MTGEMICRTGAFGPTQVETAAMCITQPIHSRKEPVIVKSSPADLLKIVHPIEMDASQLPSQSPHTGKMKTGGSRIQEDVINPRTSFSIPPVGRGRHQGDVVPLMMFPDIPNRTVSLNQISKRSEFNDKDGGHQYDS